MKTKEINTVGNSLITNHLNRGGFRTLLIILAGIILLSLAWTPVAWAQNDPPYTVDGTIYYETNQTDGVLVDLFILPGVTNVVVRNLTSNIMPAAGNPGIFVLNLGADG